MRISSRRPPASRARRPTRRPSCARSRTSCAAPGPARSSSCADPASGRATSPRCAGIAGAESAPRGPGRHLGLDRGLPRPTPPRPRSRRRFRRRGDVPAGDPGGPAGLPRRGGVRRARDAMLALPLVESPLAENVFLQAVDLYRSARRRGLTVRSSTDCLVAACAVRHDLEVLHRDRDYAALAEVIAPSPALALRHDGSRFGRRRAHRSILRSRSSRASLQPEVPAAGRAPPSPDYS